MIYMQRGHSRHVYIYMYFIECAHIISLMSRASLIESLSALCVSLEKCLAGRSHPHSMKTNDPTAADVEGGGRKYHFIIFSIMYF